MTLAELSSSWTEFRSVPSLTRYGTYRTRFLGGIAAHSYVRMYCRIGMHKQSDRLFCLPLPSLNAIGQPQCHIPRKSSSFNMHSQSPIPVSVSKSWQFQGSKMSYFSGIEFWRLSEFCSDVSSRHILEPPSPDFLRIDQYVWFRGLSRWNVKKGQPHAAQELGNVPCHAG